MIEDEFKDRRLKDDGWEITSSLASCTSILARRTRTWDMEQQTGSKSRKEHIKAVYCHPAYLTYMQSTSGEMPS